jgi:hypothetical protein
VFLPKSWTNSAFPLLNSHQGDQMSLLKNCPKYSPTHFFSKNLCITLTVEKVSQTCGLLIWFSGSRCKVMEWENKRNQKIPGSLPSPGNLF